MQIKLTGGPSKEQFVASYNAKYGTSHSDGLGSGTSFKVTNKVFPYIITSTTSASAYWLASAYFSSSISMWRSDCDGSVSYGNYYATNYGVRPLVRLKSSVKASWNGAAWDLSN